MGKLLLNRETGGYGLVTALCFWSNAPWLALVYKSTGFTAGASMAGKLIWPSARLGIHPHSSVKISAPPPLACDRSGVLVGGGVQRKQPISSNFQGRTPDTRLPVKVGRWQFETSLQVLSLSTALAYWDPGNAAVL